MKKSYKISPAIGATERRLGKHCGLEHATAATAGSQRQLEDSGTLKNKKQKAAEVGIDVAEVAETKHIDED